MEIGSLPSLKEVYTGEYAYSPCPPDIGDNPVDPGFFMHSFRSPGDHSNNLIIERLPKKMHSQLACHRGLDGPVQQGWGILIVEGPNWFLIRLTVGSLTFVIGTISVACSVITQSVQDGSSVGQLLMTIMGIGIGVALMGTCA